MRLGDGAVFSTAATLPPGVATGPIARNRLCVIGDNPAKWIDMDDAIDGVRSRRGVLPF